LFKKNSEELSEGTIIYTLYYLKLKEEEERAEELIVILWWLG